jgi:hypothetical protein
MPWTKVAEAAGTATALGAAAAVDTAASGVAGENLAWACGHNIIINLGLIAVDTAALIKICFTFCYATPTALSC